jgi:hypothetical protein
MPTAMAFLETRRFRASGRQLGSNVLVSDWPVIYQAEDLVPNRSTLRDKARARVLSDGADRVTPAELVGAIVLQRQGTIVIMEACKLFSRRRVATTACAVLPAPGIVG